MKKDTADNWLQSLEQLREIDPPAFLFERISVTITIREKERVSAPKLVLASLAFVLLLTVNIVAALRVETVRVNTGDTGSDFITDNRLYK